MLEVLAQSTQPSSAWDFLLRFGEYSGDVIKVLVGAGGGALISYFTVVRSQRKAWEARQRAELPASILGCLEQCHLESTRNMRADLSVKYHLRAERLYAEAARTNEKVLEKPGFPESWESARTGRRFYESVQVDSARSLAKAYKALLISVGQLKGLHRKDRARVASIDKMIQVVDSFNPNEFEGSSGYERLLPEALNPWHKKAQEDAASFVQNGLVKPIRKLLKEAGCL